MNWRKHLAHEKSKTRKPTTVAARLNSETSFWPTVVRPRLSANVASTNIALSPTAVSKAPMMSWRDFLQSLDTTQIFLNCCRVHRCCLPLGEASLLLHRRVAPARRPRRLAFNELPDRVSILPSCSTACATSPSAHWACWTCTPRPSKTRTACLARFRP